VAETHRGPPDPVRLGVRGLARALAAGSAISLACAAGDLAPVEAGELGA
jgi:hypothetical protein